MATGPEHYRDAERNIEFAKDKDPGSPGEHFHLTLAQVHAALALAAATALGTWNETGMPQPDRMDWWRAASGEPAERKRIKDAVAAEEAEFMAAEQVSA